MVGPPTEHVPCVEVAEVIDNVPVKPDSVVMTTTPLAVVGPRLTNGTVNVAVFGRLTVVGFHVIAFNCKSAVGDAGKTWISGSDVESFVDTESTILVLATETVFTIVRPMTLGS